MKPLNNPKHQSLITLTAFLLAAVLGLLFPAPDSVFQLLGSVFVKLIKLAVVPIVFVAVFQSILTLSDNQKAARTALLTLFAFIVCTVMASVIGMLYANLIRPGAAVSSVSNIENAVSATAPSFTDFVLNLIPTNPFQSFVEGNTFHVIFIAVALGLLVLFSDKSINNSVMAFLNGANGLIQKYIGSIMVISPIGVFSLTYSAFSKFGSTMIGSLIKYLICILASVFTIYVLFFIIIAVTKKKRFGGYINGLAKIWTVAASTSSSAATLPVSIHTCDEIGINSEVTRFVLPFGTTMNMSGAAQFIAVTFVFLAQIDGTIFSISDLFLAVFLITILVMATPGIPGGAMVPMIVLLDSFGIPSELFALILGVYSMIDMLDTTLNVTGDVIVASIVDEIINGTTQETDHPQ